MIQRFTAYRRNLSKLVADGKVGHTHFQRNSDDEPQYEGVIFSDGTVTLRWRTAAQSTSVFRNIAEMLAVHGHPEYGTDIIWHDQPMPREWEHQLLTYANVAKDRMEAEIGPTARKVEYNGPGNSLSLLQLVGEGAPPVQIYPVPL